MSENPSAHMRNDRQAMIDAALSFVNIMREVGPSFDDGDCPKPSRERTPAEEKAYIVALQFLIKEFNRGWIDAPMQQVLMMEVEEGGEEPPEPAGAPVLVPA